MANILREGKNTTKELSEGSIINIITAVEITIS